MPTPPLTVTPAILALCTDIGVELGRIEGLVGPVPLPMLRRSQSIRTIQGTLAIEGNTLTLEQVTAVLDGKRVLGPPRDILEVHNALAVYEDLSRWQPTSLRSLLEAHGVLMRGLANDAGRWRSGGVGVLAEGRVAHVAPPPLRVPELMHDLVTWLRDEAALHWLVKATVFHCELEFIHPFSDGNGRMGRLWQAVILATHAPVFAHLPVESLVRDHQRDYYDALGTSDQAGESSDFVELMLSLVLDALRELVAEHRPRRATPEERLSVALAYFAGRDFSRADYLALHRDISAPTASRDLRRAVDEALLLRTGDKASARYRSRTEVESE